MGQVDFISALHRSTKRDYVQRVVETDKGACAEVAKKFDYDYWDGDRRYGYGGYRYDGRWRPVAEKMLAHYGLGAGGRVLDVGCGKGFLLHEMKQAAPDLDLSGLDMSAYALSHAKEEIRPFLVQGEAHRLPYGDDEFDLVISINCLHNLPIYNLFAAVREIERVSRKDAYIVVESYRNEREKANLLYWQLTCEAFFSPTEWEWIFAECGYRGDYSFIFFE